MEAAGWLSERSILGMNEPKSHSLLPILQLQSNHLRTPCNSPPSPHLLRGRSWSGPHYWPGQQPLLGGMSLQVVSLQTSSPPTGSSAWHLRPTSTRSQSHLPQLSLSWPQAKLPAVAHLCPGLAHMRWPRWHQLAEELSAMQTCPRHLSSNQ